MPIIRTDLAMECFENADGGAIPGAQVSHWESGGIQITEVLVTDNEAAQLLDKPKGIYLTLECPLLMERDPDARLAMASLLAEEIDRMLPGGDSSAPVLVVGLGNRSITPDALGPDGQILSGGLDPLGLLRTVVLLPVHDLREACWASRALRAWSW